MGRPRKYTPEEFDEKIQEYFKLCIESPHKMPTKGGLALHLDMTRDMLSDYDKLEEYTNALKRAYQLIEEGWVQNLRGNNVAGTIFYLKNAFKEHWRDKQETEHSGNISLTQKYKDD